MDVIDNNCTDLVELQMSGTIERNFQTFNDELELLSAHFQVNFFCTVKMQNHNFSSTYLSLKGCRWLVVEF
jgi:hypothetical protein